MIVIHFMKILINIQKVQDNMALSNIIKIDPVEHSYVKERYTLTMFNSTYGSSANIRKRNYFK